MAAQPPHDCTYLRGMNWYTYQDLENRLLEVSKYITLDNQNRETWSETLAGLLILIGSAVDSFFRDMKDCPCVQNEQSFLNVLTRIGTKRWCIHDFRDAYEPKYEFSMNEIKVPFGLSSYPTPQNPYIHPFNEFANPNGIPDWWDIYNKMKHKYYDNLPNATLDKVINALGGLLLLNVLHKCSQEYLVLRRLIKDKHNQAAPHYLLEQFQKSNTIFPSGFGFYILTPIFHFKFRTK